MKHLASYLILFILFAMLSACGKEPEEHHMFKANSTHTQGHITSNTAKFTLQKQKNGQYMYTLNTDSARPASIYIIIDNQEGPFYNHHFLLSDMLKCTYSDGCDMGFTICQYAYMTIDSYRYVGDEEDFVMGSLTATFYRPSFRNGNIVYSVDDTIRITDGKFYITIDE